MKSFLNARLRTSKTAAVFGCGPAGLFATHALAMNGWDVVIFSKKRKSEMFGAQYLHEPIPGLNVLSSWITYRLDGTIDGYRQKVYGAVDRPIKVSPETLLGQQTIWDIREAYSKAWTMYSSEIVHVDDITPRWIAGSEIRQKFNRVISTIPAMALCEARGQHTFHFQPIWAVGDAPERGVFVPFRQAPMTVQLNGERDTGWYRSSNVFDYCSVEWPNGPRPPISGVSYISKPIWNDCDCLPWVRRIGRFGKWTKGVLSHEAYAEAIR